VGNFSACGSGANNRDDMARHFSGYGFRHGA
jgi:hypothetical protein